MAETILSVFADEILGKLISVATEQISLAWGFKEDLTRLLDSLEMIQDVLADAERRQESDRSVRRWLQRLKDVAYDADDVLDEFAYEILCDNVARIIETLPRHHLNKLQEEECWSIIKKRVSAIPLNLDLEAIGRKIAKKCGGIPLVATVLGGTMSRKKEKKLPKDLRKLINLRHIYIKRTPKDIGKLTCLQTLPFFTVGQDAVHRIEELGCLNQLRGELHIYCVEHVRDKEEARSANLLEKAKIYKLGYYWSEKSEGNHNNDEEVLEGLQPHRYLKSLTIQYYQGKKFPPWMLTGQNARRGFSLFDNLIEIKLKACNKCEVLPTLGLLSSLRDLEIIEMENLTCIGTEFYGNYNNDDNYNKGSCRNALFPSLKKLCLQSMPNLVEWKDATGPTRTTGMVFPCLEELIIRECSQLTSAPCHFPSLEKLDIRRICITAFEQISSKLDRLGSLCISNISKLASIPDQLLQKSWMHMEIWNCDDLESICICNCDDSESISSHESPQFIRYNLNSLHIYGCEKLSYFPELSIHEELKVERCPNLK
ncbi:putative disease resistance RPP13-like protein 1 [Quercus lobata]|uniref:putative disease resistance RPP13-like protein 1 n=1 Tax=Quercus lobata TaxID=97700 RepID=UPI001248AED6|nr:putative disease resistance RPP13-like protein 1 [Quercus lobata]